MKKRTGEKERIERPPHLSPTYSLTKRTDGRDGLSSVWDGYPLWLIHANKWKKDSCWLGRGLTSEIHVVPECGGQTEWFEAPVQKLFSCVGSDEGRAADITQWLLFGAFRFAECNWKCENCSRQKCKSKLTTDQWRRCCKKYTERMGWPREWRIVIRWQIKTEQKTRAETNQWFKLSVFRSEGRWKIHRMEQSKK